MSVPAAFLAVDLIWSTTPLAVKWSGCLLGALLMVVPPFFATWILIDGHAPAALPARAVAATACLGVIGAVVGFTLT